MRLLALGTTRQEASVLSNTLSKTGTVRGRAAAREKTPVVAAAPVVPVRQQLFHAPEAIRLDSPEFPVPGEQSALPDRLGQCEGRCGIRPRNREHDGRDIEANGSGRDAGSHRDEPGIR